MLELRPYKSNRTYYITLFNEYTKLSLTLLLILFTDYVDQSVSNVAGNVFIVITLANVCVNILVIGEPLMTKQLAKLHLLLKKR